MRVQQDKHREVEQAFATILNKKLRKDYGKELRPTGVASTVLPPESVWPIPLEMKADIEFYSLSWSEPFWK